MIAIAMCFICVALGFLWGYLYWKTYPCGGVSPSSEYDATVDDVCDQLNDDFEEDDDQEDEFEQEIYEAAISCFNCGFKGVRTFEIGEKVTDAYCPYCYNETLVLDISANFTPVLKKDNKEPENGTESQKSPKA